MHRLLKEIYRPGFGYQKCGVQLSHIQPQTAPGQSDLFDLIDNELPAENRPLMQVVDQINRRFPKGIAVAATRIDQTWKPKADRISQRYTTNWRELVTVYCR